MIEIYTDGSSRGNPGPGGYGVVLTYDNYRKELSQGFKYTTNNRMELLSVIAGLEELKKDNLDITIYSDSKYVVDSVGKKWLFSWEKNNFENRKNADLWKRFLKLYKKHNIKIIWVKGHSTHVENNNCDKLAVEAALDQNNHIEDEGYN